MTERQHPINWPNVLFLTLSPLAALTGILLYCPGHGVNWLDIVLFVGMFFATGLSITAGYHRHFAHVSYKAHPAVRLFFLIFGACAMENSVLNWAADHRMHHKHVDTELDPYNAAKGFWSSHIVWIFYQNQKDRPFTNVGDLLRDKWVRFQHRYHVPIALIVGFGLPTLIGALVGRPWGGFVWGGLVRVVFVHHMTFFINSLAHMYGDQPYSRTDTSRDSWWLALLTNGEGYHNFHHRFPSDYRNGIQWYHWDPTKWMIRALNLFKMTDKLHRIPPHLILKARMEVDALEAEKHLERIAPEMRLSLRQHVEMARARVEHALAQWAETRARIRDLKHASMKDSEHPRLTAAEARRAIATARQHWTMKLKEYEERVEESRDHWRQLLQGLYKITAAN